MRCEIVFVCRREKWIAFCFPKTKNCWFWEIASKFWQCKRRSHTVYRQAQASGPVALVGNSGHFFNEQPLFLAGAAPTDMILSAHLEENFIKPVCFRVFAAIPRRVRSRSFRFIHAGVSPYLLKYVLFTNLLAYTALPVLDWKRQRRYSIFSSSAGADLPKPPWSEPATQSERLDL